MAIIFATNGELLTASWLILAAMIFDFLDGFSARLLSAYSVVGKELDSLADIVSFGVAPGIIIYQLLNESLSLFPPPTGISNGSVSYLILLVASIMPVCAALRLAKFNTDQSQAKSFRGLPTPANALAVISFVIAEHYSGASVISDFTGSPVLLIIFTILLSILMISRIPLLSLKLSNIKLKGNEGIYILAGLIIVSFAILGISAAILLIPLYITASLLSLIF